MIKILSLDSFDIESIQIILKKVEEIFFLSSSLKDFSSIDRRQAFYKRWCGDYQNLYPHEFFIVMEKDNVLGYLSGCCDSTKALSEISVPGFTVFKDLFNVFPAHLHINFHPDARGKGIGSLLINHYLNYLKLNNVVGVHLVTSPDAQNVKFYSRLGFVRTETRDFNGASLYFMGHELIPDL